MADTLISIEQKRANIAWDYAQKRKGDEKYSKAPSYIKTNGLLYAIAFMYSKKDWKGSVYADLQDYFKDKDPQGIIKSRFENNNKELMQVLVEITDTAELQLVTAEAMALLSWLKRFVNSNEE